MNINLFSVHCNSTACPLQSACSDGCKGWHFKRYLNWCDCGITSLYYGLWFCGSILSTYLFIVSIFPVDIWCYFRNNYLGNFSCLCTILIVNPCCRLVQQLQYIDTRHACSKIIYSLNSATTTRETYQAQWKLKCNLLVSSPPNLHVGRHNLQIHGHACHSAIKLSPFFWPRSCTFLFHSPAWVVVLTPPRQHSCHLRQPTQ